MFDFNLTNLVELPIDAFKEEIKQSIVDFPVTLIVGETGSGKSTRVPQYILELGYMGVITQPRRLAAITVADRVAEELECEVGTTVGYQTRYESNFSNDTKLLFCTDGLGMIREILNSNRNNSEKVLVIDEVHEYNLNIEMLLAWVKSKYITEGKRVVLMSATVDEYHYHEFFGDKLNVLHVTGRTYPVEELTLERFVQPGDEKIDIIEKIFKYFINARKNTLVFLPGKGEIAEFRKLLEDTELDGQSVIFDLHGEMRYEDQKLAFASYSKPKIILSTNVAQTSVTVPDIDAVLDYEIERRKEIQNNVQSLSLCRVSEMDCIQRKGRAGRTKPGLYLSIFEMDDTYSHLNHKEKYPVPEIRRSYLDHVYLKICMVGLDPEELEFFHDPDHDQLIEARKLLIQLGCLDQNRKITELGKVIVKYPLSCRYAKMLYDADKLGVFDPVLKIVCCLNNGIFIRKGVCSYMFNSDLEMFANIENIYESCQTLTNNRGFDKLNEILKMHGFNYKRIKLWREMYSKCYDTENISKDNSMVSSNWFEMEKRITQVFITNMTDLFYIMQYGWDTADNIKNRAEKKKLGHFQLSITRDVNKFTASYIPFSLIAAFPVNIKFKDKRNSAIRTLYLLNFIIPFSFGWLDWFSEHITVEAGSFGFSDNVRFKLFFKGIEFGIFEAHDLYFKNITDRKEVFSYISDIKSSLKKIITSLDNGKENYFLYDLCYRSFEKMYTEKLNTMYRLKTCINPFTGELVKPTDSYSKPNTIVPFIGEQNEDQDEVSVKLEVPNTVRPEEPKKVLKNWRVSGKFVHCPNGHCIQLKKATKADPEIVQCDMCSESIYLKDL